jgi:hypothetical protein
VGIFPTQRAACDAIAAACGRPVERGRHG